MNMEKENSFGGVVNLFTIGYEGRDIDSFIECLRSHDIEVVFDVRQLPLSRKPYFSKNRLREKLSEQNIAYRHLGVLGSPKKLRQKLKSDNDLASFFYRYEAHLRKHLEVVEDLFKQVTTRLSCLMCFESNAVECHRFKVAEKLNGLSDNEVLIRHI